MYSTSHSCHIFKKLAFYRQFFEKYSTIKFHENSSSENRTVPCEQTDGRTDMTNPTVVFLNFANAPNKEAFLDLTRDAYLTD